MSDFWDEMQGAFSGGSGIDLYLNDRFDGPRASTSVRQLTDKMREANSLPLPVEAGTRVRFTSNIGSVLTYDDVPPDGIEGTVVTVKTSAGKTTSVEDRVFVLWDDGHFRPILAEHLRPGSMSRRHARNVRLVVSNFGDLTAFFGPTARSDELVHRATKDLWALKKDGENFVIERLFNDSGAPLKV